MFSCSANREDDIDNKAACDFCVINEQILKLDMYWVTAYAMGDTLKADSVKRIQDDLYLSKRKIIDVYNNKFELFQFETVDTLESLCYQYVPYGSGLNNEKVSRMMWYLGSEILQMNSGHSLSEGIYFENLSYTVNNVGDTIITERGMDVPILNFELYKQNQIDSWNQWMIRINLYLNELTNMEYGEMSERDVSLLYFKLRLFMNGSKSAG